MKKFFSLALLASALIWSANNFAQAPVVETQKIVTESGSISVAGATKITIESVSGNLSIVKGDAKPVVAAVQQVAAPVQAQPTVAARTKEALSSATTSAKKAVSSAATIASTKTKAAFESVKGAAGTVKDSAVKGFEGAKDYASKGLTKGQDGAKWLYSFLTEQHPVAGTILATGALAWAIIYLYNKNDKAHRFLDKVTGKTAKASKTVEVRHHPASATTPAHTHVTKHESVSHVA